VVNATMEKAVRVVSIERGRDPRQFTLVAFGGAGGLHACALAEALSIPQVIIPAFPGALSALGILASDVVKDYSRTVLWRVSQEIPHNRLRSEFSALQRLATKNFREESWRRSPKFQRSVDLRYRGQGYELNIPLTTNLLPHFEQEHQLRYGYTHPGREIELVTLRLRATLKSKPVPVGGQAFLRRRTLRGKASSKETAVIFDGRELKTRIYSRDDLTRRRRYSGPAIVTEYSATTVVPPKKTFYLDRASNLLISL